MIRALGAMMVAGCGIWFGTHQARRLERRVAALEALRSALEQAGRELELCATPLPQLFRFLAGRTLRPADGLFSACADALERDDRVGMDTIWAEAVMELPELTQEERQLVGCLGPVLGRCPGPEQGETIDGVCRALEQCALRAREESTRLGRVYRAVGAAGGGFLVILLL